MSLGLNGDKAVTQHAGNSEATSHMLRPESSWDMQQVNAEFPLVDGFCARFPDAAPRWLVVTPGRINLIGEHTDYNGFPVMPIAIDKAIYVVAAPSDDKIVELKSARPDAYADRRFEVSTDIEPHRAGDWGNYAKAAVQSLARLWQEHGKDAAGLRGMRCMVRGDIPSASGLSSSSALVIASALAFAASTNQPELFETADARRKLAERMALAEHYVGTQGGGMDQAVCMLAEPGHALRIDFFPLRAYPIAFPEGYLVIAAHSTVHASKAAMQRLAYNRRVLECAIGKELLARRLNAPDAEHLADLCHAEGAPALSQMAGMLSDTIEGAENLSIAQAAKLLGVPPDEFVDTHLRMKDGSIMPEPADGLKVLPRCRHVFSEAARVEAAAACLACGDMEALGQLMDASHRSCAEDYEISVPQLDRLVELMCEAGALGARLTGAGFGGFAIALVETQAADAVRDKLAADFYLPRGFRPEENIFASIPAPGARVKPL